MLSAVLRMILRLELNLYEEIKKGPKALSFYRLAIYIVISKPKRKSVAVGVVHFIVFSLVGTAMLFNHF